MRVTRLPPAVVDLRARSRFLLRPLVALGGLRRLRRSSALPVCRGDLWCYRFCTHTHSPTHKPQLNTVAPDGANSMWTSQQLATISSARDGRDNTPTRSLLKVVRTPNQRSRCCSPNLTARSAYTLRVYTHTLSLGHPYNGINVPVATHPPTQTHTCICIHVIRHTCDQLPPRALQQC